MSIEYLMWQVFVYIGYLGYFWWVLDNWSDKFWRVLDTWSDKSLSISQVYSNKLVLLCDVKKCGCNMTTGKKFVIGIGWYDLMFES